MLHTVQVRQPGRLYPVSLSRRTVTELRVKEGGPVRIVPLDKAGQPSTAALPPDAGFANLDECGPIVVEGRFALRLNDDPGARPAVVDYRFFRMGRPSPER